MPDDNSHFGLGVAGPNPQAIRDFRLMATAIPGAPLVDWEKGFMAADLDDEDQNGSGSCTCQAFGYDFCGKHGIQLSRNDMYSRVGQPNIPGAFPNAPYDLFKATGVHLRANAPEPHPETEAAMKKLVVSSKPRFAEFDLDYWSPHDYNIDTIAAMIQAFNGITGCFNITWEGWSDKTYPRAPLPTDKDWAGSHMLALRGFKLVNGVKKIVAKPSWRGIKYHYLGEDYYFVGSNNVFGHYAASYKEKQPMPNSSPFSYFIKDATGKIIKCEDIDIPENLVYQAKLIGYDVPVLKNPDGSLQRDHNGNIMPDWAHLPFTIRNATIQ